MAVDSPIRLDSASGAGAPYARWSYLPGPARVLARADAATGRAQAVAAEGVLERFEGPLQLLDWMARQLDQAPAAGPPFKGGWIGWLGYDLGRWFESIPSTAIDDLGLPLLEFTWHDRVRARDHLSGQVHELRCRSLAGGAVDLGGMMPRLDFTPHGSFTREGYERAVARAIEYIRAGDIFQVNLSQRFTAPLAEPPAVIYQRLCRSAPAWFGACLDYGDHALLSNSPELFLRLDAASRRIITRPIKGTRPRGPGMAGQLRESIKDQAELNMIVDLERNDLGRICRLGSVKVMEPRTIEAHPTVYHGVAGIEGVLREEVGLVDILRATFPGGSIVGAPKIRAMQIIEELEPMRRGPYCGAIGMLSIDGHMDLNIAIRTIIIERGRIHIPAGAGIVADSIPAEEYQETMVKARAMFDAVGW
jgi:para-aminobenzoate synthetase component I